MIESFEKLIDPKVLNAELIGPVGAFRVVTIKGLDDMELWNEKTQKEEKAPCLFFEECKPLRLNKTNRLTLKRLFNPTGDDTKAMIGKKVELYVDKTQAFGKPTTGVRIRRHDFPKCEACGKDIRPFSTMNEDEVVAYSKEHTGKALCVECMRRIAAEKEAAAKKEAEK